jgi:hypothetical protein
MRSARPIDFESDDLVFGSFYGDSDLLLLGRTNYSPDARYVLVATPLDPRSDWPVAGITLGEYLSQLIAFDGDKYWEL